MSLPRKSTRNGTRGYAHLVEVDVPAARVWRALTDPRLIRIWSGQESEIDPREGGMYRIGKRDAGAREAHIDIFETNRRLRLIYLSGRDSPPSESAAVDDFILDARYGAGKTSLRLLGSGISDAPAWDQSYMKIRMGWERYLARIKVTLESPPKAKKSAQITPKDPPLPGLDY
ncbi:MAG TPA: SRPBCC domain-containing protein [Steroidobacteraceae bacterium]|jgi:uncharacterized protein YndB with AHSA1/START domain|nr:SRPBCC domain-containing protein [Steroidobacteraceae bacterium]